MIAAEHTPFGCCYYSLYNYVFNIRGKNNNYQDVVALFVHFVLLVAAGWYQLVLPGGSFFWEEKTCNFRKLWYNHDTLGGDCDSAPGEGKQPDPYY